MAFKIITQLRVENVKDDLILHCKNNTVNSKETRESFLAEYFNQGCPTTYYGSLKDYDDIHQCNSGANRSLRDLIALVRGKFPKTSPERIVDLILRFCNNEHLGKGYKPCVQVLYCTQVGDLVFMKGLGSGKRPANSDYREDERGNSGISKIDFREEYFRIYTPEGKKRE